MPKKTKNIKHTRSINRIADGESIMSQIGLSLSCDTAIVGFVFGHLSMSHLAYQGLMSIGQVCEKYAGLDVHIFSDHILMPCMKIPCALFQTKDLFLWEHNPLICTDISTTLSALASNASIIYHYAFDPELLPDSASDVSNIESAFCDPRVRVIARCEDHQELLETEFNINVHNLSNEDFDAEELIRLVLSHGPKLLKRRG